MANFNKAIYASIIFVFIFIGVSRAQLSGSGGEKKALIRFKDNSFLVEVAETRQQQAKGLMFVRSLPPDSGMLFVYKDEAPRSFYMKNTYIPLDIIWLDKEKKVIFIKENAKPESPDACESIYPQAEAMYVLELNAGSSDRIGLKIGNKLQF